MDVQILQSKKGNPNLAYSGYMYCKQRVLKSGRISWRCQRRDTNCKGSMTTCQEMRDPQVQQDHNHDPNPDEVKIFSELLLLHVLLHVLIYDYTNAYKIMRKNN